MMSAARTPQKARSLTLYLALLTLVPIVLVVVTEVNKTVLIWHIRIVDFIDLVVQAPFFLIVLYLLYRLFLDDMPDPWFGFAAMAFGCLFLYGHAMHVTANAINTYSTEINDYLNIIPSDTYALIFFFDERLGHLLIYTGLFSLEFIRICSIPYSVGWDGTLQRHGSDNSWAVIWCLSLCITY